jgi:hypothetical protein
MPISARDNVVMTMRRGVGVAVAVLAILVAAISLSPARVIVANIDGPPVSVEIVGVAHVSVPCPGSQTIWVPLLRVMPRDVVVANSRDGSILNRLSVHGDSAVVIRRDGVNYGPAGSSYGPAPVNGCA